MFLLDTNVVSELRRPDRADRNVADWVDAQSPADLYLSVVTILELEMGVARIGRRDRAQATIFRQWIDRGILPVFAGRILSIDVAVATRSAALHVPDKRSDRDAFIAGTALVHEMTVVTRNIADFAGTGVALLNPWNHA